jgi:CubicO group peptidase (beta-lactamase class C family)
MTHYQPAFEAIDKLLRHKMASHPAPGLACAVTDRAETLWLSSYGFAELASQRPLENHHLFEIGSIGKSFTCLALLQLHEQGLLDLHAPVSESLPWFQPHSDFEPITPHHLMTHTAGMTVGADFAPSAKFEAWALQWAHIRYAPGTTYRYSNAGYKLLGFLVEDVAGTNYGKVLQQRILDPLEMRDSHALTTHADRARMAVGYSAYFDDRPWHSQDPMMPAPWFEYGAGDGSPVCTAGDLATYLRMLLNAGQGPSGPIISPLSFKKMTTAAISTGDTDYGYGLHIFEREGRRWIQHNGGTIGYLATMMADLDTGLGVVILTNGPAPADKDAAAELALRMLAAAQEERVFEAATPESLGPDLDEFVGAYSTSGATLNVTQKDGKLWIEKEGFEAELEPRSADQFATRHPALDRHAVAFVRHNDQITELVNGPLSAFKGDSESAALQDPPADWAGYVGHFRAYNPWFSNFRIYMRRSQLYISFQMYLQSAELPLIPDGPHAFLVGPEPTPDRIQFDTLIKGRAQRARVFGGDYYRFFTP